MVCFWKPLGPIDSDFINSMTVTHIVKTVDHPALQIQLDAEGIGWLMSDALSKADNGWALVHFHANEPKLTPITGLPGLVDHAALGEMLYATGYLEVMCQSNSVCPVRKIYVMTFLCMQVLRD